MLTALHVEKKEHKNAISKLFSILLSDKIIEQVREVDSIKLKCVTYIKRHKKLNVRKLDKVIKAQRNRILCSEDEVLEELSVYGYKAFKSSALKRQLCTNTALVLLSGAKESKKVGLVDPRADYTDFVKYLLKFTDDLTVVTQQSDVYVDVAQLLLEETGAPIKLTKSLSLISQCDLIVAPQGIEDTKGLKREAVILTDRKAQDNTHKTLVFDYQVALPQSLKVLCPSWLSETYLASALYSVNHLYRLGSLIPVLCVSENCVHTVASLKNMINNMNDKNLT